MMLEKYLNLHVENNSVAQMKKIMVQLDTINQPRNKAFYGFEVNLSERSGVFFFSRIHE